MACLWDQDRSGSGSNLDLNIIGSSVSRSSGSSIFQHFCCRRDVAAAGVTLDGDGARAALARARRRRRGGTHREHWVAAGLRRARWTGVNGDGNMPAAGVFRRGWRRGVPVLRIRRRRATDMPRVWWQAPGVDPPTYSSGGTLRENNSRRRRRRRGVSHRVARGARARAYRFLYGRQATTISCSLYTLIPLSPLSLYILSISLCTFCM